MDYKGQKQCISKSRESHFLLDYGVQRCQVTEVVFYTKVLVNDILVGLERILDHAGVRLEKFNCTFMVAALEVMGIGSSPKVSSEWLKSLPINF